MLAIEGMQNKKYTERAHPSSTCFCHEKCLWALGLGNLCFHGCLIGEGKHLIEGSVWHEADTEILKLDMTEAILACSLVNC